MNFFHLKQINRKWFLLTPEGKPFFMRGANHYGDGMYLPLERERRYANIAAWRREVRNRHLAWGFNYLPPSIGPSEVDPQPVPPVRASDGRARGNGKGYRTPEWTAQAFAEADIPFTLFLGVPKQYMGGGPYPDVFSQDFREAVDQRCRELCEPLKDNPSLIGYHFCQNPPWHPDAGAFFDWCHQIVADDRPAKTEWAHLMRRIYGTIDRWRETYSIPIASFDDLISLPFPLNGTMSAVNLRRDKIAFMKRVCDQWYKVYTDAIRKYDPNHLILGDRNSVHLQPLSDWAIHIMGQYVDVISINVMGPMNLVLREMEQVTCHWDGPIHLADTGAGIYNGAWPKATYLCRDLAEFEVVYRDCIKLGIEHPQVIGLGWCGYYETQSMRSGLVDSVTDEPDAGKIAAITRWNAWMEAEYPKVCAAANA